MILDLWKTLCSPLPRPAAAAEATSPAKTPRAIIDKLNKALNTVLAEPAIRSQLLEQGADAVGGTPEALGKVIAAELPKWAKLAKDANIKAD